MNFIIKNIVIEKKIVAKVFKFKKNKIKGVKFFTPNTNNFQIGLMSHAKNHEIKPHYHLMNKRIIKQMSELLIIFSGKLKVFVPAFSVTTINWQLDFAKLSLYTAPDEP